MFSFKQFDVDDSGCAMKVGTDSVLLGAWTDVTDAASVLDIGSGSGILSLIVAQRNADADIVGVELDPCATQCANGNFRLSPWASRLTCVCADINTFMPVAPPDLIICNPPFFSEKVLSPSRLRSQARHSGDGLSPETVIAIAARVLSPTGSLAMVTPVSCADSLLFAAELSRLSLWRRCMVSTVSGKQPTRVLWQFSRVSRGAVEYSQMAVRHSDNRTYTDQYMSLTSSLYIKF